MSERRAFIRWFSAQHRSWIEAEITKLIDSIPQQPDFVRDPLQVGDCFVIIDVTKQPHPTNYTHSHDEPRDPTAEKA